MQRTSLHGTYHISDGRDMYPLLKVLASLTPKVGSEDTVRPVTDTGCSTRPTFHHMTVTVYRCLSLATNYRRSLTFLVGLFSLFPYFLGNLLGYSTLPLASGT